MSQHSPLPWRLGSPYGGWATELLSATTDGPALMVAAIRTEREAQFAAKHGEREPFEVGAANAVLIVRAVNAHAELVNALRRIVNDHGESFAATIARAALAKAGLS